jgi:acyl-coenzyme A thioesterase PaaI-like protein
MNLSSLPFNALIGLEMATEEGFLCALSDDLKYTNHLGTVHASALFSLAENSAGYFIALILPEFEEAFVPVLRKSEVKYKKPAIGRILSKAALIDQSADHIKQTLITKNKALFSTTVDLYNLQNEVVFQGTFDWFVMPKS